MPKSLLMLDSAVNEGPNDLMYLVQPLLGANRDRAITLAALLRALVGENLRENLPALEWDSGQPQTLVPGGRTVVPSGAEVQGFVNLRDVYDEAVPEVILWDLATGSRQVILDDTRGGTIIIVRGTPAAGSINLALNGPLSVDKSVMIFVATPTIQTPIPVLWEADHKATLKGGEIIRLDFLSAGSPTVSVIGAPEVPLKSEQVWGGPDRRRVVLQDNGSESVLEVEDGGLRAGGVAGLQGFQFDTTELAAIVDAPPTGYTQNLMHLDWTSYARIPWLNEPGTASGRMFLRNEHRRIRNSISTDLPGHGTLTTSWRTVLTVASKDAVLGGGAEFFGGPAIPGEIDFTIMLHPATDPGGFHGIQVPRENLEWSFLWNDGTVWLGEVLSSTREGGGGGTSVSTPVWTVRCHGRRGNAFIVPGASPAISPEQAWSGNRMLGGILRARTLLGSGDIAAVNLGIVDWKLREFAPRDVGPVGYTALP